MMMDLRQFDITLFLCGGPVWWVLTCLCTPANFLEMASFEGLLLTAYSSLGEYWRGGGSFMKYKSTKHDSPGNIT